MSPRRNPWNPAASPDPERITISARWAESPELARLFGAPEGMGSERVRAWMAARLRLMANTALIRSFQPALTEAQAEARARELLSEDDRAALARTVSPDVEPPE